MGEGIHRSIGVEIRDWSSMALRHGRDAGGEGYESSTDHGRLGVESRSRGNIGLSLISGPMKGVRRRWMIAATRFGEGDHIFIVRWTTQTRTRRLR